MTMTYNYTGYKYTYVLSKRMSKRSNTKVFTPDSVTTYHLTIIICNSLGDLAGWSIMIDARSSLVLRPLTRSYIISIFLSSK